MRLKIKTISGSIHELEVSAADTIDTVKSCISKQVFAVQEFTDQKLIYQNRLLQGDLSLEQIGVKDGDVLVSVPRRRMPMISSESPQIPTKQLISQYASYGKPIPTRLHFPGRMRSSPTPPTATSAIAQLRSHLQDLVGSLVGLSSTSASEGTTSEMETEDSSSTQETALPAPAEGSEETTSEQAVPASEAQQQPQSLQPQPPQQQFPQPTIVINVQPSVLNQLKDMGFPEERAKKALILNRMNIQRAMEWLLEHDEDPNIDDPISQQQLLRLYPSLAAQINAAMRGGGAGGAGGGAGGNTTIVGSPQPVSRASSTPDPVLVQRLKDMGFAEDDIYAALRAVGNDQEAACAWLLGERDEGPGEEAGLLAAVLTNPTLRNALTNPRVLAALRSLMEDPSSVSQYMNDPEIGPVIVQVSRLLNHS